MKTITIKIFLIIIFFVNTAFSANPEYELRAMNFTYISENIIEFDIYLKHLNPMESTFEYSMGQYYFTFNTSFRNGGTLTYSISPTSNASDLPTNMRPRNPQIAGNILRLAPNSTPNIGEGFNISSSMNGTKIVRMRLSTTAIRFSNSMNHLSLRWLNSGGFITRIVSTDKNIIYEVTNSAGHFVNDIPSNTITGKMYYDYNGNGIMDPDEPPCNRCILLRNGFYNYFSLSSDGNYSSKAWLGLHNIKIQAPGVPAYLLPNPLNRVINFSSHGQTSNSNNFGLVSVITRKDMWISSYATYKPRPGFNSRLSVTYDNQGSNQQSGYITFVHSPNYNFVSSSTPYTYNAATRTIRWDYTASNPWVQKVINFILYTPPTVPLGTIVTSTATIYPIALDDNPANNVKILSETVVGSLDPNDKNVEPAGMISPEEILNEEPLTYRVRFQNTGTDTAFTVRVLDTLSSNLNPETLEILGSSHDYSYSLTDGNVVEWTFDNILLPDSTTNEEESHGFISYSAKPKNNLILGNEINNTAYIYFDFNQPVVTNTTNTVVGIRSNYLDLSWRLQAMYPVTDTLSVYLRRSYPPYDIVDSAKVFPDIFSQYFRKTMILSRIQLPNEYYIVSKHRNSIETWSAEPVMFSTETTEYNFTTSLSMAYGDNMVDSAGVASFFSGDVNQDGVIDGSDVMITSNDAYNFVTGYVSSDLNGNGVVDGNDAAIADNNAANFITRITP